MSGIPKQERCISGGPGTGRMLTFALPLLLRVEPVQRLGAGIGPPLTAATPQEISAARIQHDVVSSSTEITQKLAASVANDAIGST